jgi:hypothetical protein
MPYPYGRGNYIVMRIVTGVGIALVLMLVRAYLRRYA